MGNAAVAGVVVASLKKKEDRWPEHIREKKGFDPKKCNCCDCIHDRLKLFEELDEITVS